MNNPILVFSLEIAIYEYRPSNVGNEDGSPFAGGRICGVYTDGYMSLCISVVGRDVRLLIDRIKFGRKALDVVF